MVCAPTRITTRTPAMRSVGGPVRSQAARTAHSVRRPRTRADGVHRSRRAPRLRCSRRVSAPRIERDGTSGVRQSKGASLSMRGWFCDLFANFLIGDAGVDKDPAGERPRFAKEAEEYVFGL